MLGRFRAAAPWALAALALLAAVALPALAHALTTPQRAGDHAAVLRAHVAWSRVAALSLAVAAAVALARLRRRDPARGARQGIAILLVASTLAVAASLPAYDAWLDRRLQERYPAGADGWTAENGGWPSGPEGRTFLLQRESTAHEGPLRVDVPVLAKGDEYRFFVIYAAGDVEPFYRTQVALARFDACESWEALMPQGRGTDSAMSSVFMRACVARASEPNAITATWGASAPVDVRVGVILRPTYANVVEARADESVALASGTLALLAFLSLAVTTPRGSPRTRVELAALALGPSLACASWVAAALAPRGFDASPEEARAAAAAFAIVATLVALAIATLVTVAWRRSLRAHDAMRWAGYLLTGLAVFTPVPAARVWRFATPWVLLGMLGTLAVAALALVAASRMAARASADEPIVTPT